MADPIISKISVGDGATFTPSVDSDGVLSWSNNKNLPNPASVDIVQAVLNYGSGTFLPLVGDSTVTGSVEVTGGVTGNVTGNVTGDVTGDLTGNVTGDVTGNVTGNADTATSAESATKDGNGNNIANTYLPIVVGAVMAFAGSTSPAGWLLCDGSAVSRTDYADLYAVIGDTYGPGDGSTTFNLPNLVDKFIEGSTTAGTEKTAGLPNITGSVENRAWISSGGSAGGIFTNYNGAIVNGGKGDTFGAIASAASNTSNILEFDASQSNSIYGNANTVQPPALTMRYVIKY